MKVRNAVAVVWLLTTAAVETAAAAGAGVPSFGSVPQWATYVGLAVVCPEDLNRAIRTRIGGERENEGERLT